MMHKIEINAQRLWGRLNTIGAVGEDPREVLVGLHGNLPIKRL